MNGTELFITELTVYLFRWQLSTFILAPVINYGQKLFNWSATTCAIIANLIGGFVFYPFDKYITFYLLKYLSPFWAGAIFGVGLGIGLYLLITQIRLILLKKKNKIK